MINNKLTPAEAEVIDKKGTEPLFTGVYNDFFIDGTYICRRCNAALYHSQDKFDAGCGWPSFDDEIKGAVKRTPDLDGRRTEITCSNCGAHLGHVFTGEKLTKKDTRHCVNSLSIRFIPQMFVKNGKVTAVLGGGCFWCLDAVFRKVKGVSEVIAGYAGGQTDKTTYNEVSSGITGHAEVVEITYDPVVINYQQILDIFFSSHEPTTLNRQGKDIGEQYRSIILYQTGQEKEEAEKIIKELSQKKIYDSRIVTEIKPLLKFIPAEGYHQDYFAKNPVKAYCQIVISPKLTKLSEKHKILLRN